MASPKPLLITLFYLEISYKKVITIVDLGLKYIFKWGEGNGVQVFFTKAKRIFKDQPNLSLAYLL